MRTLRRWAVKMIQKTKARGWPKHTAIQGCPEQGPEPHNRTTSKVASWHRDAQKESSARSEHPGDGAVWEGEGAPGSRGRGGMGGRPERESLGSGWALFRMQDWRRSQEKGRQTLEIRETVATTQAKHRREGVKGTRNWITFSRAPSSPLSWLLPSWEAFTTMLLKVGPQIRDVSITWVLACWHSPPPAAAAKSLQLCPTLCDPIDGSPPGSSVPGILQARTLEWVAISSSNAWKWKVKVRSLSRVRLLAIPWTAAYQAPPSMGFSRQEYWSGVPLVLII